MNYLALLSLLYFSNNIHILYWLLNLCWNLKDLSNFIQNLCVLRPISILLVLLLLLQVNYQVIRFFKFSLEVVQCNLTGF